MITIEFKRAWCAECWMNCYFSYSSSTGRTTHVGDSASMAEALAKLTRSGYSTRHDGRGDYSARLWKAAPIALPIDWQMGLELADQPRETVDQNQDW